MDNIQKYLHENKSSLDTDAPDEENWTRLSRTFNEIERARRLRGRRLISLGIAASLLLAAAGFALWKVNGAGNRRVPPQETIVSSSRAVPQAEAVNSVYSPVILRELTGLGKTSFYGHNPGDFKVFSLQWKALEANEKTIEQQMRSVGPDNRLIQQLTDNYKLKIGLLQQFSVEINKVKNYLPPADTLGKIPSLSLLNIKTSDYEKE
jgi:hypothetical protein